MPDCVGSGIVEGKSVYLRAAQSLGAAQAVAQWARWKTRYISNLVCRGIQQAAPTLFNAVLADVLLVVLLVLGRSDALNAVLEVVLERRAGLGVLAFCKSSALSYGSGILSVISIFLRVAQLHIWASLFTPAIE